MTEWQLTQDYNAKYQLIRKHTKHLNLQSVLDIGCNAGAITDLFGKDGLFAVGVDKKINKHSFYHNAAIGEVEIDLEFIDKLPNFDCITLLSVLHQIIAEKGEEYATSYIYELFEKANKCLVIEMAGINSKYNGKARIKDNDEQSIVGYFFQILPENIARNHVMLYAGKAKHNRDDEPFRYVFVIEK